MTVAFVLIVIGASGLLFGFMAVYKPLNFSQLSMSVFNGNIKEHHQGLSYKPLWYSLQKPEINMQASIIVSSGGIFVMNWDEFISENIFNKITPHKYITKDSVVFGTWAASIRPQKGYLSNLILKTPQVGAIMAMAEINMTISDYLASQETKNALENKRKISELIAKTFGEESGTSKLEKSYGIAISHPALFNINLGGKSQIAAENVFATIKFRESLNEIMKEIPDQDKAINAVLVATKMVEKKIINIEIDGLENTMKSISNAFFKKT